MIDTIINVELVNGEGFSVRLPLNRVVPKKRWYVPVPQEEDPDDYVLEIMAALISDEGSQEFLKNRDSTIASVQTSTAYERKPEYCGLEWETASQNAEASGLDSRVIMHNGKLYRFGHDINMNRVNFWVAHGKVYRAEIF